MIESFKIVKYSNIKILICYKLVFDLNRLKNNFGSYIMIFTGCIFTILMIINFAQLNKTIFIIIEEIMNSYKNNMKKLNKKDNKKNYKVSKIKNNKANKALYKKKKNKMKKGNIGKNKNINNKKVKKVKKVLISIPLKKIKKIKKLKINNLSQDKIDGKSSNKLYINSKNSTNLNISSQKDDYNSLVNKIIKLISIKERYKFFCSNELSHLLNE